MLTPSSTPRLTSVMGVARALLATVGVDDTVEVLVSEFGWDLGVQALAALHGDDAEIAFVRCMERLLTDELAGELRRMPRDLGWSV